MSHRKVLFSALLISSVTLSGCSPIWTKIGDLSYSMAEFTKPAALRGLSTETDVDFAEASLPDDGVYKTPVGEYIPTEVTFDENGTAIVDTSQHPCPEGTYLNEENACMFLETETFEFDDTFSASFDQPIETGPVPCPDDTYLTEENTCTYFETETFDFADELQTNVSLPIDTGPVPCPDGTYLTAEDTCAYLDNEEFDFAANLDVQNPSFSDVEYVEEAKVVVPTHILQDFAAAQNVECPEGFKPDSKNSCIYLGAELTIK